MSDVPVQLIVAAFQDEKTADAALKGYTHLFRLHTSNLKNEILIINVVAKVPSWIYATTSYDDRNIENDISEQQKTFGFKYMVEGLCNAFYRRSEANITHTISLTINR